MRMVWHRPTLAGNLSIPTWDFRYIDAGVSNWNLTYPSSQSIRRCFPIRGLLSRFLDVSNPSRISCSKEGWASTLVHLNPATYLLGATRDWLSFGESADTTQFFVLIVVSFLLTLLGLIILKIVMPHLVARMGM